MIRYQPDDATPMHERQGPIFDTPEQAREWITTQPAGAWRVLTHGWP